MTQFANKSFQVAAPGTDEYRERFEQIDWRPRCKVCDAVLLDRAETDGAVKKTCPNECGKGAE